MIETDISDVLDSVAVDVIEGVLGNTSEAITGAVVFDDPLGFIETSTLGVSLACGLSDSEIFGETELERLCVAEAVGCLDCDRDLVTSAV